LVPSTKKVPKNVYRTECEDFCVPGPSTRSICFDECGRRKVVVTPSCGKVRSRNKLIKKEVNEEVPTTKCVVEYLCPACASAGDNCPSASRPAANQMSTPASASLERSAPGAAEDAAHVASEPRVVTTAKTEFNRLLSLLRK
jgi:hypothetical protein